MVQRVVRSPKALLVLFFGVVLGAVWAAGSAAGAHGKPGSGGVSITAGDGLLASPSSPITSTGTLSVNFAGTGVANSVARGDHRHDADYLPLSGGTLSGNLTLGPGAQLIAPRVENALVAPANPAAGQLWWNTTINALQYFDGTQWQTVATGSSGSSILGVSAPSWSDTETSSRTMATTATVTFTLASAATVVLEFGGEFELDSAASPSDLNIIPYVDGLPPQFPGETARHAEYGRFNEPYVTTQCSRLITRSLAAGTHTVTLYSSILTNQTSTIRNPWLKVSRM